MNIVLDDVRYKFAMTYMDDVVIFSRNLQEHLEHLDIALQKMQRPGFAVNPKKTPISILKSRLARFYCGRCSASS